MHLSRLVRRFFPLVLSAGALAHAAASFAGASTVDLSTSIGQVVSGPVQAGATFQLDWVIANQSGNASPGARGQLSIDARSQFIGANCPLAFEAGVLSWTPTGVAPAAPGQCRITLRSDDALSAILAFDAWVDASGGDADTDMSNNAAALQVEVQRGTNVVDLAVALEQVVAGPVIGGAAFDLRWMITNNREGNVSSAAEGRLQLPPQVELMATSCPSELDAGIVTWTPPSVDNAVPRQCVVSLRSTASEPAELTFETLVATSAQDTDSDLGNNAASLRVAVERGVVPVRELPAGGWPAGIALAAALIVCALVARRRFALASPDQWAGSRPSHDDF